MTCCVSDRSSRSSSTRAAQHPDRTLVRHTGKIPSRGLFPLPSRSLSASIRTKLPICCSFRCGCATGRRPLTADFASMRSPRCAFWWAGWRYFWGRPHKGSRPWLSWSWVGLDIRGRIELSLLSEGRHEGQLRAVILVEVIPKQGDVPASVMAYLLYSLSWLVSSMFMLLSCRSWGINME